jgi:hypothetical protein
LIGKEFLGDREEHEEEEMANAGPSENVSQPTRQAKPTPELRRKKRKKHIGRIKTAGWIINRDILLV